MIDFGPLPPRFDRPPPNAFTGAVGLCHQTIDHSLRGLAKVNGPAPDGSGNAGVKGAGHLPYYFKH